MFRVRGSNRKLPCDLPVCSFSGFPFEGGFVVIASCAYTMTVRTIIFFLAGLLVASSIAAAQNQDAKLTDGEFATFVTVNVDLQKLAEEYHPALNAAGEDAAKRAGLQQQLQKKTQDVLARNNLTPEAYRQIYETVNADPPLRTKALLAIEAGRQKEIEEGGKKRRGATKTPAEIAPRVPKRLDRCNLSNPSTFFIHPPREHAE